MLKALVADTTCSQQQAEVVELFETFRASVATMRGRRLGRRRENRFSASLCLERGRIWLAILLLYGHCPSNGPKVFRHTCTYQISAAIDFKEIWTLLRTLFLIMVILGPLPSSCQRSMSCGCAEILLRLASRRSQAFVILLLASVFLTRTSPRWTVKGKTQDPQRRNTASPIHD